MPSQQMAEAPAKPQTCEVCLKTLGHDQNLVIITSVEFRKEAYEPEPGSLQGRIYFHTECFIGVAGKRYLPSVVERRSEVPVGMRRNPSSNPDPNSSLVKELARELGKIKKQQEEDKLQKLMKEKENLEEREDLRRKLMGY
jgi:hypothetical protein